MSLTTAPSTTASTTFIDLATFSELESFTYGGKNAVTLFVAAVQKANWFSFIPIALRWSSGGAVGFGQQNVSASVNRSGDYVLNVWFRAQIPMIGLRNTGGNTNWRSNSGVAWTNKLMHNLISKCNIAFNELIVQEFDNYYLDALLAFKVPVAKRAGYNNMIGDVASMTQLSGNASGNATDTFLNAVGDGSYRSVPLPFWFADDSGVALPVAALPFNDVKITYSFRAFKELIVIGSGNAGAGVNHPTVNDVVVWTAVDTPGTAIPELVDAQTFAHYAVVHNDERQKMGDQARDVLITQVQISQSYRIADPSQRNSIDIRFSHSIIALFFMIENTSLVEFQSGVYGREGSNYTTQSGLCYFSAADFPTTTYPAQGSSPIAYTQLLYENTARYSMSSDYYMWVAPYYFANNVPQENGYHMISYSLETFSADPKGSTNFSKLANVSLVHDMSQNCKNSALTTKPLGFNRSEIGAELKYPIAGVLTDFTQKYRAITLAINRNVARIANGSLGHPTL